MSALRQIVLDTETTGLESSQGHRIIEIGCVEMVNRRLTGERFHIYLNPDRDIDEAAVEVHGISADFLADKPRFGEISEQFLEFIRGAEIIIHNAPFDVGFLNAELRLANIEARLLETYCTVIDSLIMARKKHPGQRNSLDALCKRYAIDNSHRQLHGALLDAEILADVYLAMTGGQVGLQLHNDEENMRQGTVNPVALQAHREALRVIMASEEELAAHRSQLQKINQASGSGCLWLKLENGELNEP